MATLRQAVPSTDGTPFTCRNVKQTIQMLKIFNMPAPALETETETEKAPLFTMYPDTRAADGKKSRNAIPLYS